MHESLTVDTDHIHIRQFLTDNFLIETTTYNGEKIWDYNNTGQWKLSIMCTITTDVQERLDHERGPASFVGHMTVTSSPFFIQEYVTAGPFIKHRLVEEIKRLVSENKHGDITQHAPHFVVDIEPLLGRNYIPPQITGTPDA